jgi:MFS transporter, FSR family, fosmidomycin resistance protein
MYVAGRQSLMAALHSFDWSQFRWIARQRPMTATDQTLPIRIPSSTVYAVLFAAAACHMINDTLQATMLAMYPMLRSSYSLTFAQIGMITLVFQVTASILQPVIGHFTDRRPLPYSLPVAPFVTLLGLVLLGLATSYYGLLIAAAAIGVGSAIFHPEASRVSRLASGGRFGMAQSLFQVGGNVGSAIGPLLVAAVIVPYGQSSVIWFGAIAIAAIAILGYVGRWYSVHLSNKRAVASAAQPKHGLTSRTVNMSIAILLALMFSKFVYMASLHSFYTFYLIDRFHVSVHYSQIYLFVFLGAVAVGTYAGGPIGDKIGRKAVIWFSILGTLPFSLALPYANLFWTVALTIPIGLILSSAFSAMVVYAQELMPGRVGMISGLFFGFAFGIAGLGAALLGALADHTSISFVFELCSVLPAIGLLAVFLPGVEKLKPAAQS